jgi:hypothetical protein
VILLNVAVKWMALKFHIHEAHASNFDLESGYPESFRCLSRSLQTNIRTVLLIWPQPIPSTPLQLIFHLIKSYRAISHVWCLQITDGSETVSVPSLRIWHRHQILIIGTDMVPETSVIYNQLARYRTRKYVIKFNHPKSLTFYIIVH